MGGDLSVILVILYVYQIVVFRLIFYRTADKTPVLAVGENIARTASITCCRVVGHIRKPHYDGQGYIFSVIETPR